MHLTEVREAESRMALIFPRTVTLTGRAAGALPAGRSSSGVGVLDCQKLSGGDLILSHIDGTYFEPQKRAKSRTSKMTKLALSSVRRGAPNHSLVDLSYPAVLPLGSIRTEWVIFRLE